MAEVQIYKQFVYKANGFQNTRNLWLEKSSVPHVNDVKGSMNPLVANKQSWLKGRAEAAEVKLLKSILHSASTNVLHSDWGQSDR